MTTYTTTAGNVAFYMNLAVVASTPDEAETKFLTFIADSKAEDEEYEMALAISPDAERAQYKYTLGEITALDDYDTITGYQIGDAVVMTNSGANG